MEINEILKFSVSTKLKSQYKAYLNQLAELAAEHIRNQRRLERALRSVEEKLEDKGISVSIVNHAKQADWLDKEKYEEIRKKVLDLGNDLERQWYTEIDKYKVNISKQQ